MGGGSFREAINNLEKSDYNNVKKILYLVGEDERAIWQYALNHDLLPNIIQAGMLTAEELDSISIYFKTHIPQNGLNIETFDRLSIAVANLA